MVYGGAVVAGAFEPGRRPHREDDRGGHPGTWRSRSRARSATRSARSAAGRSGSTAAVPTSSDTGAGCTWTRRSSTEPSAGSSAGRTGRSLGQPDARRPLVRLDPGGGDGGAVRPVHAADARGLRDLVLRVRGRRVRRRGELRTSTTRSATSTTSSRCDRRSPAAARRPTPGGAASPRRRPAADERDGRPVPRQEGRSRGARLAPVTTTIPSSTSRRSTRP